MSETIVIVGGVAAGASAAAKARRVNEQATIVLFERGPYVSFANCGLPYYVSETISDRASLLLQSPESFWKRFRVRVHVYHEVVSIDRNRKILQVKNLQSGETFEQPYDKLVLATGAGALIPPIPGIQSPNIFTVKTVPDSDAIKTFLNTYKPKRAIIAGAGFIGLESAEALHQRGLEVTVVEMAPQVLPPFDADIAQLVETHLLESGIHVVVADGIKAFHGSPLVSEVELQSGKRLPADFVILSIGVRPETKLAKDAGLELGKTGGIVVNDHQQTSDPSIYAAGDSVEITHLVTGQKTRIPLAGPANKQGRVAGSNAAGDPKTFPGAYGTAIVETMGITAAKTGLSEKEAQAAGLSYFVSHTHAMDHAGYYPGGEMLHMKLLTEEGSGRLLGAQIVGEKGVDKRIDVLATALAGRMRVTDLENLDLAYAPQFSSAKDPVNMAGFVAANILRNEMPSLTCEALQQEQLKNPTIQIVDVRSRSEYETGHLPHAQLIPVDELRDRIHELDAKRDTVVYCRVGFRGYIASRILRQHGFEHVRNLSGGILSCAPESKVEISKEATITPMNAQNTLHGITIDVREADEFAYEKIAGTQNIPLSVLPNRLSELPKDKPIRILCQSGVRSQQALALLNQAGFTQVVCIEGGLNALKTTGQQTITSTGPIPIMRQVQICAGSLVLIGTLMPNGKWLAAFVGAGLIFAGISGTCAMATLLGYFPWNRKKQSSSASNCNTGCGS